MSIPVMDLNLCALECFPLTLHTRKQGSEDIDSLHKGHIGCTWNETWTISWQDLTTDGPFLVEMNCRSHIGDGNWALLSSIQNTVGGKYCQVEGMTDCYLDEEGFHKLPVMPPSPL